MSKTVKSNRRGKTKLSMVELERRTREHERSWGEYDARRRSGRRLTEETRQIYRRYWEAYCTWCANQGLEVVPGTEEGVVRFVEHLAREGHRAGSIRQHVTALRYEYACRCGAANPALGTRAVDALRYAAAKAAAPTHTVWPMGASLVRRAGALLMERDGLTALQRLRNRALLFLGWAGGLRAGELVALQWTDVQPDASLGRLLLRYPHPDHRGVHNYVYIPQGTQPETCPVHAVELWRNRCPEDAPWVFPHLPRGVDHPWNPLTTAAIRGIVKDYASRLGMPAHPYSGDSLKHGVIADLTDAGMDNREALEYFQHRRVNPYADGPRVSGFPPYPGLMRVLGM